MSELVRCPICNAERLPYAFNNQFECECVPMCDTCRNMYAVAPAVSCPRCGAQQVARRRRTRDDEEPQLQRGSFMRNPRRLEALDTGEEQQRVLRSYLEPERRCLDVMQDYLQHLPNMQRYSEYDMPSDVQLCLDLDDETGAQEVMSAAQSWLTAAESLHESMHRMQMRRLFECVYAFIGILAYFAAGLQVQSLNQNVRRELLSNGHDALSLDTIGSLAPIRQAKQLAFVMIRWLAAAVPEKAALLSQLQASLMNATSN